MRGGISRLERDHAREHAVAARGIPHLQGDGAHQEGGERQLLTRVQKLSADKGGGDKIAGAKQRERGLKLARRHC
jgi:hypothetical protein